MAYKILIVDDDVITCNLITRVLQLHGYEAVSLADYRKINDTLATEQPDLVLLDYYLGAGLGADLLQEFGRTKLNGEIMAVVMASGIDRKKESLAAGADAFMLKPFNWEELVDTIETTIQRVRGDA